MDYLYQYTNVMYVAGTKRLFIKNTKRNGNKIQSFVYYFFFNSTDIFYPADFGF